MLWTFAAFLLILSLLLLQSLKKLVASVKKSYFAYPSDAVIDQILPQEIMEHVMTFLDPRAMIECRLVSKYWHHHAIKPTAERAVHGWARTRLREVYDRLTLRRFPASTEDINRIMSSTLTHDMHFVRASAIASKHGADLIVANRPLCNLIVYQRWWRRLETDEKCFMLMSVSTGYAPWRFATETWEFKTTPMFDETAVDWPDENIPRSEADILFDMSTMSPYLQDPVKLYSCRLMNPPKFFYFIPLNHNFLHALVFLCTPMIVHDILHSNYLPIKSWFGPIMFLVSLIIQLFVARSFIRHQIPSPLFKITFTTSLIGYLLLTCITYPASMSVFASMGIQALMVTYFLVSKHYFMPYGHTTWNKKKLQALTVGAFMLLSMVDWKLVVDATRDLSIFGTLFYNTLCYCVVLLHVLFDNVLRCAQRGSGWRSIVDWGAGPSQFLRSCYLAVIWMTLVVPIL